MPIIPQPNANGVVRSLGFSFNFSNAFATTAQLQGIPVNTSFATLQASLGANTDLYPTQLTAWGRANQAQTSFTTLTTPSGVGQVGTVGDAPAPLTSLWAYSKLAYQDAQTAATNANAAFSLATTAQTTANTALTNASTAQTTADNAQTTANTALTNANNAQASFTTLTTPSGVGQVGTSADSPSLATSLWALAKQNSTEANNAANLALAAQTTANKALTYNVLGTTLTGSWTQGIALSGSIPTTFSVYPSTANLFGYWTFNAPLNTAATDSFLFNLTVRFETTNQHTSAYYYAYQIGTNPDVNIQPFDDVASQQFSSSRIQLLTLPLVLTGNFSGATIKVKIYVKSGAANTIASLPSVFPATVQIVSN
jgi:hypothetical protein